MKEYIRISNEKAYQLINSGALLIACTTSNSGQFDMALIAWHTPVDYDPVTRLLIVLDKQHKTFKNITETKQFALAIPHIDQLALVKQLGSCSGIEVNKIEKFHLETFEADQMKILLPTECIGYIECKVYNILNDGEVALIFGEAVFVKVDKEAYTGRLLTETKAAKILYHVSGKQFTYPADEVIK